MARHHRQQRRWQRTTSKQHSSRLSDTNGSYENEKLYLSSGTAPSLMDNPLLADDVFSNTSQLRKSANSDSLTGLLEQLTLTNSTALLERALIATGLLLSEPSMVSRSLLHKKDILVVLCQHCSISKQQSHLPDIDQAQIRSLAVDALCNALRLLNDIDTAMLRSKADVIVESCLKGLTEGLEHLQCALTKNSTTIATDAYPFFHEIIKTFDLLCLLVNFECTVTRLIPLFNSTESSSLRSITISFAAGWTTENFYSSFPANIIHQLEADRNMYASFASGSKFLYSIITAIQIMLKNEIQGSTCDMRQKVILIVKPVVDALFRNDSCGRDLLTSAVPLITEKADWILTCIDTYLTVAEICNDNLDKRIPLWNIDPKYVVESAVRTLCPEVLEEAMKLFDSAASEQLHRAGDLRLKPYNVACSSSDEHDIHDKDIEFEGGERLNDIQEVAAAKSAETAVNKFCQHLEILINALHCIATCSDITYVLKYNESYSDDYDEKDTGLSVLDDDNEEIMSASRHFISEHLVSILLQSTTAKPDMLTLSFLKAVNVFANLHYILSQLEFSKSLENFYVTLCHSLQAVFHCIATVVSSANFPLTSSLNLTSTDVLLGPVKKVLMGGISMLDEIFFTSAVDNTRLNSMEKMKSCTKDESLSFSSFTIEVASLELFESSVHMTMSFIRRLVSTKSKAFQSPSPEEIQMAQTCVKQLLTIVMRQEKYHRKICSLDQSKDKKRASHELGALWTDIQILSCELCCCFGMAWKSDTVIKEILQESLSILEQKETNAVVTASILDMLFDLFCDETFDHLYNECSANFRLAVLKNLSKRTKLHDTVEKCRIHTALKNLPAFLEYKRHHVS